MKTLITLIMIAGFIHSLPAQEDRPLDNQDIKALIVGTWMIDESLVDGLADEMITGMIAQNPKAEEKLREQRDAVANMIRSSKKEYRSNGTYRMLIPGQGTKKGKWHIDKTTGLLVEIDQFGKETRKEILSISELRIVTAWDGKQSISNKVQ